jgi:hypothetical protein
MAVTSNGTGCARGMADRAAGSRRCACARRVAGCACRPNVSRVGRWASSVIGHASRRSLVRSPPRRPPGSPSARKRSPALGARASWRPSTRPIRGQARRHGLIEFLKPWEPRSCALPLVPRYVPLHVHPLPRDPEPSAGQPRTAAARGHAAALPSPAINSRRLTESPRRRWPEASRGW